MGGWRLGCLQCNLRRRTQAEESHLRQWQSWKKDKGKCHIFLDPKSVYFATTHEIFQSTYHQNVPTTNNKRLMPFVYSFAHIVVLWELCYGLVQHLDMLVYWLSLVICPAVYPFLSSARSRKYYIGPFSIARMNNTCVFDPSFIFSSSIRKTVQIWSRLNARHAAYPIVRSGYLGSGQM